MKSELAQRLLEICTKDVDKLSNDPLGHFSDNEFNPKNLTKEQVLQVEEELIKHYEFERIVWIQLPADLDENGEPVIAKSRKITSRETPRKGRMRVGPGNLQSHEFLTKEEHHDRVVSGVSTGHRQAANLGRSKESVTRQARSGVREPGRIQTQGLQGMLDQVRTIKTVKTY